MNKKVLSFFLVFFMMFQYFIPINVWAKNEKHVHVSINGVDTEEYDITSYVKAENSYENYIEENEYKNIKNLDLNGQDELDLDINVDNNGHRIGHYRYYVYSIHDEGFKKCLKFEDITEWIWYEADKSKKIFLNSNEKEYVIKVEFNYNNGSNYNYENKWIGVINSKNTGSENQGSKYLDLNITTNQEQYKLGNIVDANIEINPKNISINEVGQQRKKQVAIVMDVSGSMDWHVNCSWCEYYGRKCSANKETRLDVAKKQCENLLNTLENQKGVEVLLIPFSTRGENKYDNSSSLIFNGNKTIERAKTELGKLRPNGGTNIGDGMRIALHSFSNDKNIDKSLILFTDGEPTYRSMIKGAKTHTTNCLCVPNYNEYYIENKIGGNYFDVQGAGNSDNRGFNLEYATIIGGLCKEKGIQSTVVGFSSDVSESTIGKITDALGGEYAMATNEEQLQEIFNRFANSVENHLNMTNVKVEVEIPQGLTYQGSTYSNITQNGNKLIIDLPNIVYTKKGESYVANEVKVPLKFEVSKKDPRTKEIKGIMTYKDFKGSNVTTSATKSVEIVDRPAINYLSLETLVPQKVLSNSEFDIYNKIYPTKISRNDVDSDNPNLSNNQLVLRDLKLELNIENGLEYGSQNTDNYKIDGKKMTIDIGNITYKLKDGYYVADPIENTISLKSVYGFIGDSKVKATVKFNNETKATENVIEIVHIDELSITQQADKTTLKKDDKVNVEYIVSGNEFKIEDSNMPETIKVSDVIAHVSIPNRLSLTVDGTTYNSGQTYELKMGEMTFKKLNGVYVPSKALNKTLQFNVVTEKEGEILKLESELTYRFNNENEVRSKKFNSLKLLISPGTPDLKLELSNKDKSTDKFNLAIISDVDCTSRISIYDKYNNLISTIGDKISLKKGQPKNVEVSNIKGAFIKVEAENILIGSELKAKAEETVPVINLEGIKYPSAEPIKDANGTYTRVGNIKVSTDNDCKIMHIKINNEEQIKDSVINGQVYESKTTVFKHGKNTVEIKISKNGNTSTFVVDKNVDANPPIITNKQESNDGYLTITFSELIKVNLKFEFEESGVKEVYTKENLEEFIIESPKDGSGIQTVKIKIPNQWAKKKITIIAEDLAGNIGKGTHDINKEKVEQYVDLSIGTDKDNYLLNDTVDAFIEINPKDISISDVGTSRKKQVAILIDISSSMSEWVLLDSGYKTRLDIAKEQCERLLEKLKKQKNIEVILVPFSENAKNVYGKKELVFGDDKTVELTQEKLKELKPTASTNIGDAIRVAMHAFDENSNSDKHIILFSDGEPTMHSFTKNSAESDFLCGEVCNFHPYEKDADLSECNDNISSYEKCYYYTGKGFIEGKNIHWHYPKGANYDENDKKYAVLMGEICKKRGIQSTVVGFSKDVSEKTIGRITNALGGEYAMATDDKELEKIFDRFANSVDKDISLTDVTVNVTLPEGTQLDKTNNSNMVQDGNKLTFNLPNITYTKNGLNNVYTANTIKLPIKLKITSKEPQTKVIQGKINYKDFNGERMSESASKYIKIVDQLDINYLTFDTVTPNKVLMNSNFNIYNKIIPSDIPQNLIGNYNPNLSEGGKKFTLKDVKLLVNIDSGIELLDYEDTSYRKINDRTLEITIGNIEYTLKNGVYSAAPIDKTLKLKATESLGIANIKTSLIFDKETKVKNSSINIVQVDEVSVSQQADKTTLKKGDKVTIEYIVSGNQFEADLSDNKEIAIEKATVSVVIPNKLSLTKDGKIYNSGEIYNLPMGDITFSYNNGAYVPSKPLKEKLVFDVVTEKEGEFLKVDSKLSYKFNGEENPKIKDFNTLNLLVSPGAADLKLTLTKENSNTSNLVIKSDVQCTAKIKIYTIDDNKDILVREIGEVQLYKDAPRNLSIDNLKGAYIKVESENTVSEVEGIVAKSESTVPIITLENIEYPTAEPTKNDNGYNREGNIIISTDKNCNIVSIGTEQSKITDVSMNGQVYESKTTLFKHGENIVKIVVSKNGNTSTLVFKETVDANPPIITATETADKKYLDVTINEPVKDNIKFECEMDDKTTSFTKENLKDKLVQIIDKDGKIIGAKVEIPEEWIGKTITIIAEDLSGNIGKVDYNIQNNKEKVVVVDDKGTIINDRYATGNNITTVRSINVKIGVKLKVIFDGELKFDVMSKDKDVEIKNISIKDKNNNVLKMSPDNSVDFSKYYNSPNGIEDFIVSFDVMVNKKGNNSRNNGRDIIFRVSGHGEPKTKNLKLNILDSNLE